MRARTLDGADTTLADAEVRALDDQTKGRTIVPGDPDYDEARAVWNGLIDRRPAVIARCRGAADVLHAVRFAREHDLLLAVRGGGHNVAGSAVCDGGIVVDLSPMRAVRVDPAARRARVEGGALWGDVDHETQAHGLATTGGIVSHTGVAGLTLGGGIGWLMRKHGLTADNLVSVDLVTAEGQLVKGSVDEHPDLFRALRGGGGNFGVVTSFEFDLHALGPTVLAGPVFWDAADASDVLRLYRDIAADGPDELGTVLRFGTIPPLPVIPEALHWRPALAINFLWAGAIEKGERVLEPLRTHGEPAIDLVGPKPYLAHQGALDGSVPHGWHYYWKSTDLSELSDGLIDVLVEHGFAASSPRSYSVVFHLGGAVRRLDGDGTVYSGRHATHNININGVWQPDEHAQYADTETRWVRDFFEALAPFREGVYVNFLDADDGDCARART
ncbi:MAG: FAD-binding oxidoreductase [Gemmatimonadota bacterium]